MKNKSISETIGLVFLALIVLTMISSGKQESEAYKEDAYNESMRDVYGNDGYWDACYKKAPCYPNDKYYMERYNEYREDAKRFGWK